eukprot:TRINITY_DN357_c0_g2_i1.p1 TRINITY_DN357_c0_g2~~TRINITY_DN357_c0_g2_i1.p1  ORF type:complete len:187 (-),score=36.66 TRINITY_DN357_c0_g2_i1:129-689(-)
MKSMMALRRVSTLARQSQRFFATNNNNNNTNNTDSAGKAPTLHKTEFEPFKFGYERQNLEVGYTIQELYGARFGLKHSPSVKREMLKDSILFCVGLFFIFYLAARSRDKTLSEDSAFKEYLYSELNTVRAIPDRVKSTNGEWLQADNYIASTFCMVLRMLLLTEIRLHHMFLYVRPPQGASLELMN